MSLSIPFPEGLRSTIEKEVERTEPENMEDTTQTRPSKPALSKLVWTHRDSRNMYKAFMGLHQIRSLYLYFGLQFSVLMAYVSMQKNESLNLVPFLRLFSLLFVWSCSTPMYVFKILLYFILKKRTTNRKRTTIKRQQKD